MMVATRKLEIDCGHRLLKHEGKCRNVHGHRYVFEVTVGAHALDDVGRVIDFSLIKSVVGGWLDEHLDHGFIAEQGDPIIEWLEANDQKHLIFDVPPTIENLTMFVFRIAGTLLLPHGVEVKHVRGYETPNCWSDYGSR